MPLIRKEATSKRLKAGTTFRDEARWQPCKTLQQSPPYGNIDLNSYSCTNFLHSKGKEREGETTIPGFSTMLS
jgi:hypothetical protein